MKRKLYVLVLILFYSVNCFGGKLEKGFEQLEKFDYFSAKENFEKSMKSEPAAASYGLAMIFSVNNNPFYSIDSARKYIQISVSLINEQKEKVKRYYAELGITDSTINALNEFICADAFNFAQKEETSAAYNHFISDFNSCSQTGEVIELRNDAAFSEAEELNTSAGFKAFMAAYPMALQFEEAQKKFDELIYKENTDSSIESYQFFIQNFPESPYLKQAEKMIYSLLVPDKTIEQYAQFARTHSNSPYFKDAWHEVYLLGMPNFSEQTYNNFKSAYPDYPYNDELETDYKLQNTFFLPFEEDNLFGYINDTGVVMISPQFEEASMFKEGLAVVAINEQYGYINKAGKLIIDYLFDDAELFNNSAAVVLKDSLFGLIDKNGQFIINPSFEELTEVDREIYMAVKNGRSGYVLRSGDTLTGFEFDVAYDFINGYAIVSKDEKLGIIDSTGSYSATPVYDDLVSISERFLKAMNDDEMWGMITFSGDTVLPFDYDAIGEYSEGLAMVVKNDKSGFIDEARSLVIPISFPYSSAILNTGKFKNGYALLNQKYSSILIDTNGKKIKFSSVQDYGRPSQGFFPVRKNSRWGFADQKGKVVIPCKYQSVESFVSSLAVIRQNKLFGVIDTTGIEIIPPLYNDIVIEEGVIIVKNNSGAGLFSKEGAMIFPCEFETIEFIRSDLVKASGKDKFEFVNLSSGKIISSSEQ